MSTETFVQGDKVTVLPDISGIVKPLYQNREGMVMRWHHDEIYTVYMNDANVLIVLRNFEMEKL